MGSRCQQERIQKQLPVGAGRRAVTSERRGGQKPSLTAILDPVPWTSECFCVTSTVIQRCFEAFDLWFTTSIDALVFLCAER